MTKTDVALLPCPFCGAPACIFDDPSHSTAWEVACLNKTCSAEPNVWEITKAEVIAAWNTRTTPEPTADLVDLIDALEELATWLRLNGGPRADQVMKARAAIAAISFKD